MDPLVELLDQNKETKTLTLVSKDSLYSYVFSIYDRVGNRFALKLIPIGKSEDSKVGIRKIITSDSQLVKEEFNNLQEIYSKPIAIGPKPYFYKIYEYPQSVIGLLQDACEEPETSTAVYEIKNLFDVLKDKEYQDIQLGCILMEYIPGKPLLEIITNIVKKYEKKKKYLDPKDQPDYQAVFINAISKIIFLFMEGYFLDDCHLGNIIIEIIEIKKRKREEEAIKHDKREEDETSEVLKFLSEKSFDSRLIDLDRVYKRTQIYEDYKDYESKEKCKEAFIDEVRNIFLLQGYNAVALLHEKNELITKLLDSDNPISLKDIKDIHDLRIILSIIRASSIGNPSDEYEWLEQFLYNSDNDFLRDLLTYLHIMSRELEVHAGGKTKKSKTKKSKTKKSKTKKSKIKKKLKPNK